VDFVYLTLLAVLAALTCGFVRLCAQLDDRQ